MRFNQIFELSMLIASERFNKVLANVRKKVNYMTEDGDMFIDNSMVSNGITIIFCNTQYRKQIKLIIDMFIFNNDHSNVIDKLNKFIYNYFSHRYQLADFTVSSVVLITDIDVNSRENVSDYIRVFQRIGKVKAFTPTNYEGFDNSTAFCVEGNTNAINMAIYDLEKAIVGRHLEYDMYENKLRMDSNLTGILRAEVKLAKPKAIRNYITEEDVSKQIISIIESSKDIFLDVMIRIIPYGNFYKKDIAIELINERVKSNLTKAKMIKLIESIPVKKSILGAQRATKIVNIDAIMDEFTIANVSPVTIGKRHEIKNLKCIYDYIIN